MVYPHPFSNVARLVRGLGGGSVLVTLIAKGKRGDYTVALHRFGVSAYFSGMGAKGPFGGGGTRGFERLLTSCGLRPSRVVCVNSAISSVISYERIKVQYLSTS